jgi:hypothetical protein
VATIEGKFATLSPPPGMDIWHSSLVDDLAHVINVKILNPPIDRNIIWMNNLGKKNKAFQIQEKIKPWTQIISEPTCMSKTIKEA